MGKFRKEFKTLEERQDLAHNRIESLVNEKMNAEEKAKNLEMQLINQQIVNRDEIDANNEMKIRDLEREKFEKDREITGLKKISDAYRGIMEENNALKIQVDTLAKEKLEIMERFKNVEDQVKITSRRLSRSADEVIDLNDTVSTSMFKETSTDSLPFHGFESPEVSNMEISSKQENKLKRNHSSPGTTQTKKNKRHPPIGSMIMIDAIDRKGVY